MKDPQSFDDFYQDSRARILAQAYALTGDLSASRAAVRDAYVAAWHHWRKVSRLTDREAWVRTHAWQHAQRRHSAHPWHKEKDTPAAVVDVLKALAKLSTTQRKALILTAMAKVGSAQMAREVGLPLDDAEREQEKAATDFAVRRELSPTGVRQALSVLETGVEETNWPRVTIVRRAGATRRRLHTATGATAAVIALFATGAIVTNASGLRPTLSGDSPPKAGAQTPDTPPPAEVLPPTSMLTSQKVELGNERWTVRRTHDNSAGNGKVVPCQTKQRYIDPAGEATLVRTFEPNAKKPAGKKPRQARESLTQFTEVSVSKEAAAKSFATAVQWFANCVDKRTQLLATKSLKPVGDQAIVFGLRSWRDPVQTQTIGISRTGTVVTILAHRNPGDGAPDFQGLARTLSNSVTGLCPLDAGGQCASKEPALDDRSPVPVGTPTAMLSVIDVPPVGEVTRPWSATRPVFPTANLAASRCDEASFAAKQDGVAFTKARTRSYLLVDAPVSKIFGITETVGALPDKQAKGFVGFVRDRVGGCPNRDLGTDVTQMFNLDEGKRSLTVWQFRTEVSDSEAFTFQMAIMRSGTAVAQLGFVPDVGVDMADGAFVALAQRALARLDELPAPKKKR